MIVRKCKYDHALPLLLILHWSLHVVHDKIQSPKAVYCRLSSPCHSVLEWKHTTYTMLLEVFPTRYFFSLKIFPSSGMGLPASDSSRLSTPLVSEKVP